MYIRHPFSSSSFSFNRPYKFPDLSEIFHSIFECYEEQFDASNCWLWKLYHLLKETDRYTAYSLFNLMDIFTTNKFYPKDIFYTAFSYTSTLE